MEIEPASHSSRESRSSASLKRVWKRVHRTLGYLSPPYQLCSIARIQRCPAIVERCRRPDVSTQTYLTPVSRYRHPRSIITRVPSSALCRVAPTPSRTLGSFRSTRFELSIDIFVQWPSTSGSFPPLFFLSVRACKLTAFSSLFFYVCRHEACRYFSCILMSSSFPTSSILERETSRFEFSVFGVLQILMDAGVSFSISMPASNPRVDYIFS